MTSKPHMSELTGHIQVATAAILFGLIGIFVRLISDMPLGSIIFYRLLVSLVVMALFFTCFGRFRELEPKENKAIILLLGIFQAVTMLGFFTSIKYTSVSIAVLLLYTAPVYVALLSPLILKERMTRHGLAPLIMSMAGVIIMVRPWVWVHDPGNNNLMGLAAGLASGLAYGSMILTSRYLRHHYTGTVQAAWALFITLVLFIPYSAVPVRVLMDNLFILLLFGIVPTMALVLYFSGLMHIRAHNASIVGLLEPVSAVVFAHLILDEPISSATLMGGALILLGTLLVSRERPVDYAHE